MESTPQRQQVFFRTMLLGMGCSMLILALAINRIEVISFHPAARISTIILIVVGCGLALTGLLAFIPAVHKVARNLHLSEKLLNVALVLGGMMLALFAVEMGLRWLESKQPDLKGKERVGIGQTVTDPRLGLRLAPNALGHDVNGFRNADVPEQVDIVAIGDSQTYGISASRDDAWPQTLDRLSGRSVYNMGLGYYGSVQYWVLLEEALEFSPEIIVVGLYFGNDLWGAYDLVYHNDYYRDLRDETLLSEVSLDTIGPQAVAMSEQGQAFEQAFWRQLPLENAWRTWLVRDTAIGRLLYRRGLLPNNLQQTTKFELSKAWAEAFPEYGVVYNDNQVRTVLTTGYRLLALDLAEPRIAEGLRITKEVLLRIQTRTDDTNSKLLILLIPTKEMVYADSLNAQSGNLDPVHAQLVEMESQARREILALCHRQGLACLDGLPALAQAVQRREQIYPTNTGGHPIGHGYLQLASAVNEMLVKLNW